MPQVMATLAAVLTGSPSASHHFHCFVYASLPLASAPAAPACCSPCVWLTGHVHLRALANGTTRNCSRLAVSLELAWQPSWRSLVASHKRPRPPASRRLTCGPQILDSINMMACKCCATSSILSLSTQIRHIASSPIPRPFMLMRTDCFP
jgi:hypothetical protein